MAVNDRPPQDLPDPLLVDPHIFGTFCGLSSAIMYTGANSFLRAVHASDPVWVSAVKAIPTVVAMAPVMVLMARRGQQLVPSLKILALIAAGGLLGQLGGNVAFQWALHVIGVALTVPLSLGGMIVAAAILGRLLLHEPVTARVLVSLSLLLAAIFVLSLGAKDAGRTMAIDPSSPWLLAGGVAAGCGSGVFYAILNVILRYCVTRGAPLPTALFTVSVMGLMSLSGLAWWRIGSDGILATGSNELTLMLAAGTCNTVAFVALTKSLQLTSVVYVNALNATQATLAAVAGVVIFREALSPWLAIGVGLTIAGLMSLAHAHRAMRTAL
jgi:DME family drug/metabolite transporter